MPENPNPLAARTSFEPLNLAAFAVPLNQMQQKYDITTTALEDSKFDIATLSPIKLDVERGSILAKRLEKDRDEVLENLKKTKNYRQAAKKLKEINKMYNEDPEITGLRTQTKKFQEFSKQLDEMVKEDELDATEATNIKAYTLGKYDEEKGFSYDRNTGKGNPLRVPDVEKSRDKELMTLSNALAKGTVDQIKYAYRTVGKKMGLSDQEIETTLKYKDKDQVAREVRNFMAQSERFKNYYSNRAEFEFFVKQKNNPEFAKEFLTDYVSKFDNRIEDLQSIPTTTKEEQQLKEKLIEEEKANKQQFIDKIEEAEQNDMTAEYANKIYNHTAMERKLPILSDSAADLYDYNTQKRSLVDFDGNKGSSGNKKTEEEEILDYQIDTVASPIDESDPDRANIYADGTNALTEIKGAKSIAQNITEKTNEAIRLKEKQKSKEEETGEFITKHTSGIEIERVKATDVLYKKVEKAKENLDKKIDETQKALQTAGPKETTILKRKLKSLNLEKSSLLMGEEEEFGSLNRKIEVELINDLSTSTRKIYDEEGVSGLISYIANQSNALFGKTNLETFKSYYNNLTEENKTPELRQKMQILNDLEKTTNILKDYVKKEAVKGAPITQEIFVNEPLKNSIGEVAFRRIENALAEVSGNPSSYNQVKFNSSTGKIDKEGYNLKENNITQKLYNFENAKFVGFDNGNTVFRISRPKNIIEKLDLMQYSIKNEQNKVAVIAKYNEIKNDYNNVTGKELQNLIESTSNTLEADALQIIKWEKENPETTFIAYDKYGGEGIEANAHEIAKQRFLKSLNDQRPLAGRTAIETVTLIDMLSNPDTRVDYNQTALALKEKIKTEDSTPINYFPHSIKPVQDKEGNEFNIGYQVQFQHLPERDAPAYAKIIKLTYNNSGQLVNGTGNPQAVSTLPITNPNNPAELRKITLFFGAGNNNDKLNNDFVPAFQTESNNWNL